SHRLDAVGVQGQRGPFHPARPSAAGGIVLEPGIVAQPNPAAPAVAGGPRAGPAGADVARLGARFEQFAHTRPDVVAVVSGIKPQPGNHRRIAPDVPEQPGYRPLL